MMAESDKTYYLIERINRRKPNDEPQTSITSSLGQLHNEFAGLTNRTLEEFTEDVVERNMLHYSGIEVKIASKKDVANFGPAIAVFDACDEHEAAERIAKETQREAELTIIKYVDEHATDKKQLAEIVSKFPLINGQKIQKWARNVENDYRMSDDFLNVYGKFMADTSRTSKKTAKEHADGFYQKKTEETDRDKA